MADKEDTQEVFSDVYAVLNKNWVENHRARLCEILEKVERECDVEICFVKGAYQFRGALKALSNVFKSLQSESHKKQSLPETSDVVEGYAQQRGELPNGEDPALYTAEVSSGSDVILTQSHSCGEGNASSGAYASDVNSSRGSAAGNDNLETSTNEGKPVNKRMQHEGEEQAESVSLGKSVDRQGIGDRPAKTLDSVSDLTVRQNRPSHPSKAAVNQEQRHDDGNKLVEQHCANNATDASLSLSSYVTKKSLQTSDKDAGTSYSDVDASARCDTLQSQQRSTSSTDETKSSSTAEHEQEGLQASNTSFQSHHSVAASVGKDSGLTDDRHGTELVAPSESSARPRLADANKDVENKRTGELPKVLIYARISADPSLS